MVVIGWAVNVALGEVTMMDMHMTLRGGRGSAWNRSGQRLVQAVRQRQPKPEKSTST